MATNLANDKYRATLRSTFVDGVDTALNVTAIPSNLPTLVTVGWNTQYETVFAITGTSGSNSSNYALTGLTKIKGYSGNLPENLAVNCLNHEEFFNQFAQVVNDSYIRLDDFSADVDTPSADKAVFYMKNGAPYVRNDAGTVTQIGFKSDEWIDVADAATMTIDLSETIKKLKYKLGALTDNRTLALSNIAAGLMFLVRIMQDSTGSRSVTWFNVVTDTVTMTIANPGVITTTKDLKTGTPVKFTTTGALPTGITAGTQYYWIRTSATTGNLATSKANALAGTTITTSGSQSGTHTMAVQIIWADDSIPSLSTDKHAYDDFMFIVHDLNTVTGVIVAQNM